MSANIDDATEPNLGTSFRARAGKTMGLVQVSPANQGLLLATVELTGTGIPPADDFTPPPPQGACPLGLG